MSRGMCAQFPPVTAVEAQAILMMVRYETIIDWIKYLCSRSLCWIIDALLAYVKLGGILRNDILSTTVRTNSAVVVH